MINTRTGNKPNTIKIKYGGHIITKIKYQNKIVWDGAKPIVKVVDKNGIVDTTIWNSTNFGIYTPYPSSITINNDGSFTYNINHIDVGNSPSLWSGSGIAGIVHNYDWLPVGNYNIEYDIDFTTLPTSAYVTTKALSNNVTINATGNYTGTISFSKPTPDTSAFFVFNLSNTYRVTTPQTVAAKMNKLIFRGV